MNGVKLDKWGYQVKTSSDDCISAINSYYDQFLEYGRKRSVILEAVLHDPNCVLANILAAYFVSSADPSKVHFHLDSAKSQLENSTSYEKAVFEVVSYLMSKDRDDDVAVELHFKLLRQFPKDLVSLKRAQGVCFYMARPDISLDLVKQVLPHNQEESYVYGMLAFPLLELGRMVDAEEAARKGLEIYKFDLWSQHNLCHVLQYYCQFKEAAEFMKECSLSWSCSSFMYTHNWWHVALCYLDGHSPLSKVLEIYDNYIFKELQRSDAVSAEVYLNALALLLRIDVRGQMDAIEDRLELLADCVADQSVWHVEWHLDLLILWALAKTNRLKIAENLLNAKKLRLSSMSTKKRQSMYKGIMLAESVYEYGRSNYERALELLGPNFDANNCKIIGASDEQIDVFNEVWYIVLLNTGQFLKAIEEIEKRIKKTEGIPFLWRLLERGYILAGRKDATVISEKARNLEAAYFEQAV
ncbi:tetratricopeptide repeat protein 38 isoform X2 [Thalictrum thalictroides]|uniref:Tetratricopeptide repeat protein 38 n=1 Tax=Thalictrum thalictroides TaxID=46969 RepID=A0A7J6WNN5_THATH|nr:tetratricopeptide repeat protein 38 isoform X2 [Thalictrum thalictroides]